MRHSHHHHHTHPHTTTTTIYAHPSHIGQSINHSLTHPHKSILKLTHSIPSSRLLSPYITHTSTKTRGTLTTIDRPLRCMYATTTHPSPASTHLDLSVLRRATMHCGMQLRTRVEIVALLRTGHSRQQHWIGLS